MDEAQTQIRSRPRSDQGCLTANETPARPQKHQTNISQRRD